MLTWSKMFPIILEMHAVAQEASKQSQAAIGKAADKATETIKELGQKREAKWSPHSSC